MVPPGRARRRGNVKSTNVVVHIVLQEGYAVTRWNFLVWIETNFGTDIFEGKESQKLKATRFFGKFWQRATELRRKTYINWIHFRRPLICSYLMHYRNNFFLSPKIARIGTIQESCCCRILECIVVLSLVESRRMNESCWASFSTAYRPCCHTRRGIPIRRFFRQRIRSTQRFEGWGLRNLQGRSGPISPCR